MLAAKPLLTHSFNCGFSGSGERRAERERAERVCRESREGVQREQRGSAERAERQRE